MVRCATTSLALRGTTPSSVFTAYAVFLSRQLARQISSLAPVQLAVGALVVLRRRTARRLREYMYPSERAGGLSVVSLNKGVSRGKGTGPQGFRTKTLYERARLRELHVELCLTSRKLRSTLAYAGADSESGVLLW